MLPKSTVDASSIVTSRFEQRLVELFTEKFALGTEPLTVNCFCTTVEQPSFEVTVNETLYNPTAV